MRSKRSLYLGQALGLMRRGGTLPSKMSTHWSAETTETLAMASCVMPALCGLTMTLSKAISG